jgi:hypothetical protein
MANIWDYFKNLFQEAEESTPSNPLIHKMIERTEDEKADYEYWKNTLVRRRMMDWLNDQFSIFNVLPDDIDESLDFLDTPSSKGFAVYFHKTQYSRRDVTHFFDFLKEQVLKLEYRTQISDLRTYNRPKWVETVQRHYLKPKPDFMRSGKFDQRFGNVMIELYFRDDKPHQVLFRATTYKDHLFKDAEEFQGLMQAVCMN